MCEQVTIQYHIAIPNFVFIGSDETIEMRVTRVVGYFCSHNPNDGLMYVVLVRCACVSVRASSQQPDGPARASSLRS